MARKSNGAAARKTVTTLKHEEANRRNIPTAEVQSVLKDEDQRPLTMRYQRNRDLDPQLVWRGKDEQDWSDLVVQAPPLYIQEKIEPKVLIDDLRRQSAKGAPTAEQQLDMFADRTSAHTMRANQLRLWFASVAYVLVNLLRAFGLAGTEMARAQAGTIRTKLLKVGAVVRVSVRRLVLSLSAASPVRELFGRVAALLEANMPLTA
jgi:hypothetical protein